MNETGGETKLGGDVLSLAQDDPAIPANGPDPAGLEDITTRALQFMSTASKETIGGIAVGLAACTYLVLGRVGLVLIGAFGGVLLHASWEGQTTLVGTVGQTRKEKGLDVVKRILEWRDQETSRKTEAQLDADDNIQLDSFDGFRPETAAALNNLADAIIRDYVKWWYGPVLPQEEAFPAASRQILTKFLLSISQHLSRKRPADAFLDFLTNSSSIVIVFLNELSSALSLPQSSTASPAEAVYAYLSANPDSNLANVLNEKQQTRKFKIIADDILQNFLEKRAYECDPARIFLREILAGVVLEMTLKSCSKPEWINGWIVYLLEEGEPDISQAIDAGVVKTDGFSSAFDGFDGNIGSIDLPKEEKKKEQEVTKHQKRVSRAEEAMEEAMNEAKRLSQLIAEEDKKKPQATKDAQDTASKRLVDAVEKNAESLDLNTSTLLAGTQLQNPTNDGPRSSDSEPVDSPTSPRSTNTAPSVSSSLSPRTTTSFTSFDQIVPQAVPVALQPGVSPAPKKVPTMTLHNANIIIHDDSSPTDKGRIRNKPTGDYLVQIEPESSQHPGWMIVRRYPDFETLHEVLRRIAAISGVTAFTEQHNALPSWKEHTKPSLRGELERYLRDACWYQPLAESEGMKRFLEKDSGQMPAGSSNKAGFGWPTPSAFETMGKGMLDVLTSAPKGAAEGGKVVLGGVTGVFNNIGSLGQKKMNGSSGNLTMHTAERSSTSTLPRIDSMGSINGSRKGRASEDSLRTPPIVATQPSMIPPMERKPSYNSIAEDENDQEPRTSNSARSSFSGRRSATLSREASRTPSKLTPLSSPVHNDFEEMRLPPPPSNIADDYGSPTEDSSVSHKDSSAPTTRTSTSTAPSQQSPGRQSLSILRRESLPVTPPRKPRKEATPLTEQETRVAVELMFAVINELYTLSSAWNFRRTLLTAAKTFLLRPGNPSLSSIQSLIQDSVITANTSDAGIASHLKKLRENSLPTEEELKAWPPETSAAEKERLRLKARKLLVERGVPAALTGVMGQAATGEAMGRVFDCLQIEEVARGLIFGLLLQGVRAVTH